MCRQYMYLHISYNTPNIKYTGIFGPLEYKRKILSLLQWSKKLKT